MINRSKVSLYGRKYFPRSISESLEIFIFKLMTWVVPLGIISKAVECLGNYESIYPVWSKVGVAAICIPVAFLGDWMEKRVDAHFDSKIRKALYDN